MKLKKAYICHTYYHVYIAILKKIKDSNDESSIILSNISNDFSKIFKKLIESKLFYEVIIMNEIHPCRLLKNNAQNSRKSSIFNIFYRIKINMLIAKRLEKYIIDIEFKKYHEIFVFCDSDPIGRYLNYKKIPYHAIEDGLDSLAFGFTEKDNQKYFNIKIILAKLGLIFIENGYSKYAIDIEVNNKTKVKGPKNKVIQVPRKELLKNLSTLDIDRLCKIFMPKIIDLRNNTMKTKKVLLITQPLCDLKIRLAMYKDIINEYCQNCYIYIKPHPKDELEYDKYISNSIIIDRIIPIELLNFAVKGKFNFAITVYSTSIEALTIVEKKISLGIKYLRKYEPDNRYIE